jgi:hypothetical protein
MSKKKKEKKKKECIGRGEGGGGWGVWGGNIGALRKKMWSREFSFTLNKKQTKN